MPDTVKPLAGIFAGGAVGWGVASVVAGARAVEDAADTDSVGDAAIGIGEAGAGGIVAEDVARQGVVGDCEGGRRGSIIDFVDTGGSYRQSTCGDVGRSTGGGIGRVVGGIGA